MMRNQIRGDEELRKDRRGEENEKRGGICSRYVRAERERGKKVQVRGYRSRDEKGRYLGIERGNIGVVRVSQKR
jgi:hypothetical protein